MIAQTLEMIPLQDLPANLTVEEVLRIIEGLKSNGFQNVTSSDIERIVEISKDFPPPIFNGIVCSIPFSTIRDYTDSIHRIESQDRLKHTPWTMLVFDGSYGIKSTVQAGGFNFLIFNMLSVALTRLGELIIKILKKQNGHDGHSEIRQVLDYQKDEFLAKYDKQNKVKIFVRRIIKVMNQNKEKFPHDNYLLQIIHRFPIDGLRQIVVHQLNVKKLNKKFHVM